MTKKGNHSSSRQHVTPRVNYSSRLHVFAAYIDMSESTCKEAMREFIDKNYDELEKKFAEIHKPTGKKHGHPKAENLREKVTHWWEDGTTPHGISHYAVTEFFKAECAAKNIEFEPEWFDLPLYPDLRKIPYPKLAKAINLTFGYYSAFDSYRIYALEAGNQADEKRYSAYYKIWRIRSDDTLVNDVLHVQGSENGSLCCTLYRYSPSRRLLSPNKENGDDFIKVLSGNIFVYGDHFYAILSDGQGGSAMSPEPVFLLYPKNVGSKSPSIGIHSCIIEAGIPLSGTFLIYRLHEADQPGFNIKPCIRLVKIEDLETEEEKLDAKRYRSMLECGDNKGGSFIMANPVSLNKQ